MGELFDLNKRVARIRTRFMWLRIETSDRLLWKTCCKLGGVAQKTECFLARKVTVNWLIR